MRELVPSLALLATALAAATWVQIGLGLRPLARVREGIAAIRAGQSEQIDASVPSEVAPLVQEINDLSPLRSAISNARADVQLTSRMD